MKGHNHCAIQIRPRQSFTQKYTQNIYFGSVLYWLASPLPYECNFLRFHAIELFVLLIRYAFNHLYRWNTLSPFIKNFEDLGKLSWRIFNWDCFETVIRWVETIFVNIGTRQIQKFILGLLNDLIIETYLRFPRVKRPRPTVNFDLIL